jgi:RNA polymerase sigma-70 factor (ECF subfamily)
MNHKQHFFMKQLSQGAGMHEAALIAAARLGDEDAFTELYRQHLSYVKAVGRAVLRKNDLDDLCQDTFLQAFTRLDSFEGNSQFRTWITRIALNECLMALRRNRHARDGDSHLIQMDPQMAAEDAGSIFASVDAQLEGVAARLDLDKLLSGLQPAQCRILRMAYLEEIPVQEIAEILGIHVTRVNNTIQHTKRRLRKKYKE